MLNIEISSNQVNFSFGDIKLISKVIDGKFPDYNRVIPSGHQNTFTVNRLACIDWQCNVLLFYPMKNTVVFAWY